MPKKKRIPLKRKPRGRPATVETKITNPKNEWIGHLKGVFKIVGDIESPAVPPEAWEYD